MLAHARRALVLATWMIMLPLAATAGPWQVTQASGPVFIGTDNAQPVALARNAAVPVGATLTTGPNGRAALARGAETMVVGPNSVIMIPAEEGGSTTILERSGTVEFEVEKQNIQHFAVETPFLAAVVKGTHFTVTVEDAGAAVHVDRGLVEVTNLATGEVADVPAGRNARVGGTGSRLSVDGGREAEIRQATPRPVLVAALNSGDLSVLRGPTAATAIGASVRQERDHSNGILNTGNNGGPSAGGPGGTSGPGGLDGAGPGIAVAGGFAALQAAAAAAPTYPVALPKVFKQHDRGDDLTLTDLMIAGLIAASAFLALGFAFLRARLR